MTAVVQLDKLAATLGVFAFDSGGDEVVTWGDPELGGDSTRCKSS